MPDNLLAIDVGTQSTRVLLFDPQGKIVAKSRVVYDPYYSTGPGLAEQKAEVYWDALCKACRALWRMDGVIKDSVAAVALTTQRSTIVNVDDKGVPLRPAMHWLDQRRTEGLPPLKGLWGLAFTLAGAKDTVG